MIKEATGMELREVRARLKSIGYNIKTKKLMIGRFADIVDARGNFIVGSSASAYPAHKIKEHQIAFDFYNDLRITGVADKGEKIIL